MGKLYVLRSRYRGTGGVFFCFWIVTDWRHRLGTDGCLFDSTESESPTPDPASDFRLLFPGQLVSGVILWAVSVGFGILGDSQLLTFGK